MDYSGNKVEYSQGPPLCMRATTWVPFNQGPDVSLVGTVDGNGYEWIVHEGVNYWRLAGSGSGWTRHQ